MTTEPGIRTGPASPLIVPIAPTPLGYRVAKRTLDLAGSLIGLLLVSPVLVVVAIAVKFESRGPVFFRQQRLGLGGRPFTLYKFRTMFSSAEQEAHRDHVRELIRGETTETRPEPDLWLPIVADRRVTRLGGFLRRSHLDELPQLINIVRGEMSLVGPRPPIPYEV